MEKFQGLNGQARLFHHGKMTAPPVIVGHEHQLLELEKNLAVKEWLATQSQFNLKGKEEKILGLYKVGGDYTPGNFIGMVWIGEGESRAVLRVNAKLEGMDYIRMYCECTEDPKVSDNLHCLHLGEGDLIDAPDSEDFSLLIAVAYLRELKALCSRHLRRHFLRERQNFAGKVKGKILAGENLRRNVLRCRPDRVYCEYQSVSDDILENRILRAALERAARYVASKNIQKKLPRVQEWIRLCRSRLCGVSIARIRPRDFAAARKRGVFAHYARPLQLAKAVLRQLGFNPQTELNESTKTPPYAINSEELFERFAELKLREHYGERLVALYRKQQNVSGGKNGDNTFNVSVRPDFYVACDSKGVARIIDAKYKNTKKFTDDKPAREDMYQVVAYSQHNALLEKIKRQSGEAAAPAKIILSLVYPRLENDPDGEVKKWKTNAFRHPLFIQTVPCPVKPAE